LTKKLWREPQVRNLTYRVFKQHIGQTVTAAIVLTVIAYLVAPTAGVIVGVVLAVPIAIWWIVFLING
jgi:hypothetical protein